MNENIVLLSAAVATGASGPTTMDSFPHATFSVFGVGATAATVNFVAGYGTTPPDFGAAKSLTNNWGYIEVVNNDTGAVIDGNVGAPIAATDFVGHYSWNVPAAKFIGVIVSAYTSGAITVHALKMNNIVI